MIDDNKKYYFLCSGKDHEQTIIHDYFQAEGLKMVSSGGRWLSRSTGYETLESMFIDLGILENRCKICNNLVETHFYEPTRSKLINKNYCFSCNIWDERLPTIIKNDVFIINGCFYSDGGMVTSGNRSFIGHGGRLFKIQRNTGEIIETNNLWNGGDIPPLWIDKFPNNAKFI